LRITITKRRKAISPVLATVILIAITLIAAIAVAGFVFGLFGSFTSTAHVMASVASCTTVSGNLVCTLTVQNTGTANAAETSCTIQLAGAPVVGTWAYGKVGATTQTTFVAGTTQTGATCTIAGTEPPVGSMAEGTIATSNGASVPFSGVWS